MASKKIYVSVIIPVYNDQIGIQACLEALAIQSYPQDQYEVIVVDNDSNPPIAIDPAYTSFARILYCSNPGSYAARNTGISAAEGEILAFTDADCIPDQYWIQKGVDFLLMDAGKTVVGGDVHFRLSNKPTTVANYQSLVSFGQKTNIEYRKFIATANFFATREQFILIGGFDERLLSGGDLEWCWRAIFAGFTLKYAEKVVVHTSPRNSLAEAIRQTRRVAGGRFFLRKRLKDEPYFLNGTNGYRSFWKSLLWITSHSDLSRFDRLKILGIASFLKLTHNLEILRLYLLGSPERR